MPYEDATLTRKLISEYNKVAEDYKRSPLDTDRSRYDGPVVLYYGIIPAVIFCEPQKAIFMLDKFHDILMAYRAGAVESVEVYGEKRPGRIRSTPPKASLPGWISYPVGGFLISTIFNLIQTPPGWFHLAEFLSHMKDCMADDSNARAMLAALSRGENSLGQSMHIPDMVRHRLHDTLEAAREEIDSIHAEKERRKKAYFASEEKVKTLENLIETQGKKLEESREEATTHWVKVQSLNSQLRAVRRELNATKKRLGKYEGVDVPAGRSRRVKK